MRPDAERERLRQTFDQAAEHYARVRPDYPDELFDDLVALTGVTPGDHLLEVGCATGKATLPLARRGFRITCVALGAGLAAAARGQRSGLAKRRLHHRRYDELRDAVTAPHDERLPAVVDQNDADGTAIVAVDRAGRVETRDARPQREAAARAHLHFESRRNFKRETGRHERAFAGPQRYLAVDRSNDVGPGRAGAHVRRERKPRTLGQTNDRHHGVTAVHFASSSSSARKLATSRKSRYTLAKRTYAIGSTRLSASISFSPI